VNPFRKSPKPATKTTILPEVASSTDALTPNADNERASSAPRTFPRYPYLSPASPAPGDRAAAVTAFELGAKAQAAEQLTAAAQAFQKAAQADGSYFEAQYNLGRVQYLLRDYSRSLATWERALAVQPGSADARYMFALTLNAAGYAPDAALELEKIVAANANDARAHLLLGNLYAEQLRDKTRARVHYQRLLELDSRHPNASQIRYWLVANPA
jgi:tetratricopeptide (TPR) repeat protein